MKLHFANQKAIDESAAIRKRFPDMGARREALRLLAAKERWVQRMVKKNRLTKRELKRHCVIETMSYISTGSGEARQKCLFIINWTWWMKLKRWLRRKLKGESECE